MKRYVIAGAAMVAAVALGVLGGITHQRAPRSAEAVPTLTAQQMVRHMNPECDNVAILSNRETRDARVLVARYSDQGQAHLGLIYFQLPNRGGYEVSKPIGSPQSITTLVMGGSAHGHMLYWLGVIINNPTVAFIQVSGPRMLVRQAIQPGEKALIVPIKTLNPLDVMAVSNTGKILSGRGQHVRGLMTKSIQM